MRRMIYIALVIEAFACNYTEINTMSARIDSLPSFNILMLDSSKIFHSDQIAAGTPTIFFYFKTDCSVCRKETKMLLENINSFQGVNFYFLTYMPLNMTKQFNDEFKLNNYKNIIIGKDDAYSFAKIFNPTTVPFTAIYDSQKKLAKIYKGEISLQMISTALKLSVLK